MIIFLYNVYVFIWIKHGCLATVFALDFSKCYKKVMVYLFLLPIFLSLFKAVERVNHSELLAF